MEENFELQIDFLKYSVPKNNLKTSILTLYIENNMGVTNIKKRKKSPFPIMSE